MASNNSYWSNIEKTELNGAGKTKFHEIFNNNPNLKDDDEA